MDNEQKNACWEILQNYGQAKQEIQAVQELSELICVLTRRPEQRAASYKAQLIDEIADSLIMIEQVKQMHAVAEDELQERIDYKLQRQLDRMNGRRE